MADIYEIRERMGQQAVIYREDTSPGFFLLQDNIQLAEIVSADALYGSVQILTGDDVRQSCSPDDVFLDWESLYAALCDSAQRKLESIYEARDKLGLDDAGSFSSRAKKMFWGWDSTVGLVGRMTCFICRPSEEGEAGDFLVFQGVYAADGDGGEVEHGAGVLGGEERPIGELDDADSLIVPVEDYQQMAEWICDYFAEYLGE